jgi:hypothetical protein
MIGFQWPSDDEAFSPVTVPENSITLKMPE